MARLSGSTKSLQSMPGPTALRHTLTSASSESLEEREDGSTDRAKVLRQHLIARGILACSKQLVPIASSLSPGGADERIG